MFDLPDGQHEPISSFNTPVSAPSTEPGEGVLHVVCFNQDWLPVILGALDQLLQETTWKHATDSELADIRARVADLIDQFGGGCTMIAPGQIIMFAGDSTPDGWLNCDGAEVSRSTYAALFTAIGTAFGVGDGTTTFNLPDFKSRLPVGTGAGGGLSTRAMADTGGEEAHVLTVTELASHGHSDSGHFHSTHTHLAGVALTPGELPVALPEAPSEATSSGNANIQATGGDSAHNTMPPFLAVTFIIKT